MAGAVTGSGIEIELTTELKSAPYVDITLEVLDDFGITAEETDEGYAVPGGQSYETDGGAYHVPGDFSSMSYLLAAGALAGDEKITVTSAVPSAQGDSAIVDILDQSSLSGIEVGVEDTPDLLPTIATLGAAADGVTRITDAEHVRYKETDRVSAMAEELSQMGARIEEKQDELVIYGEDSTLSGTTVDGRADHRIIMSLAVAGLIADGETTIQGGEHVDVSFPGFFDVLDALGGDVR
jgi:3-phosphoshikimate 1-carboxyvinyltransferase